MEVENKELLRVELRKKIDKYIKEFPIYFYSNIFLNLIIISLIIITSIVTIALYEAGFLFFGALTIITLLSVCRITLRGFLRNLKIIKNMNKGSYDFDIKSHEMDNAIEFIEDLPMAKVDVDKLRVALSFNKLIDVLDTVRIIRCGKEEYSLDVTFDCDEGIL